MQTNYTQFGRVEFDPLSIPTISIRDDRSADADNFENRLERVITPTDHGRLGHSDDDATRGESPATDSDTPSTQADAVAVRDDRGQAEHLAEGPLDSPTRPALTPEGTAAARTKLQSGEAAAGRRHLKTGKGPVTVSPNSLRDTAASTDIVAGSAGALGSATPSGTGAQPQTAGDALAAAGSSTSAGSASSTGAGAKVAGLEQSPGAQARGPSGASAGYRTLDSQATLRLAEQQRDSIFRQVSMRLTPDGGEMHVFIDPPELGELELRMVVERGGESIKLTVIAERPEVAWMMQRHIAELKEQLESQGMRVTDAQIHTREEHDANGAGGEPGSDTHSARDPRDSQDTADADASPSRFDPTPRGFVHANGLEVWI